MPMMTAENVAEPLETRMGSLSQVVLVNGEQKENSSHQDMRVNKTYQCWQVCLGMQLTCIEFAGHVLGLKGPIHPNWIQNQYPIIDIMRTKSMWKTWEERPGPRSLPF